MNGMKFRRVGGELQPQGQVVMKVGDLVKVRGRSNYGLIIKATTSNAWRHMER